MSCQRFSLFVSYGDTTTEAETEARNTSSGYTQDNGLEQRCAMSRPTRYSTNCILSCPLFIVPGPNDLSQVVVKSPT
jgi:hypothetical protein